MLKRWFLPVLFLAVFILVFSGCGRPPTDNSSQLANQPALGTAVPVSGQLKVHFLDVGQADSILVQFPNGQNMLIDAGNNDDGSAVVNYIRKTGIGKIDYLIGTHPHEDHIGGLDTVINNFDILNVYMPRVTHTTKTFEDVLRAVQRKGLKITPAKAGVEITNTNGLSAKMLAPNNDKYESLNNYSAVIKITFGQVSFLLTGDAEELSESEILKTNVNLKSSVLKVGHHGSRSSTSIRFLSAVNPKYAVISVGAGNDYGHPHRETIERLNGIKIYRTDINGNIVFTTDGNEINIATENNQSTPVADSTSSGDKTYIDSAGRGLIKGNINSKGEKIYHLPGGAYYEQTNPEIWFKTESTAQAAGFRASNR